VQERFGGRRSAHQGLRLERGDGVLAVGEGGAEALERDVGRCAVREVRWFGETRSGRDRVLGTEKWDRDGG
jgi:hypothetical protein